MITLIFSPTLNGEAKAWIEDVVVEKKYRGMGIGKKLVLRALEKAGQLGARVISLTSRPSRVEANKLYKKLGFELVGTNCYRYKIE